IPPEYPGLPFCGQLFPGIEGKPDQWTIEVLGPAHLTQTTEAPTIRWVRPDIDIDHYVIAFSLGGKKPDVVFRLKPDRTSFRGPPELWSKMMRNAAYWWALWAVPWEDPSKTLRVKTLRAIIHHQSMERVPGSRLRYSG